MSREVVLLDAGGREIMRAPADPSEAARAGVGSGASIFGGRFMPFLLQDDPALLDFISRHETYRVMSTTDSYIAESLRTVMLPLLSQAKWRVKPAIEPRRGATPTGDEAKAQDIADFCGANLLGQETEVYGAEFRQVNPWSQFLRECGMALPHGFSAFHRQPKAVGGKLAYGRLLWLEPRTIFRWDIDGNDELRGLWRNYLKADGTPVSSEYIPVAELFLVVWDITGTRLEGVPLIRSQYGPWKRKEFIQRCKMIALQQAGVGVPIAKWDPAQNGDVDPIQFANRVEQSLQSMLGAGIGTAYLAVPNPTFEASILKADAAGLKAFDDLATRESLAEAHGGSTKSMMLGELPGGSRSTGQVQKASEAILAQAFAKILGEQITTGVGNIKGLIQELIDWNFAGVKRYPSIQVSGVDPEDAGKNIDRVVALAEAGMVKYRPALEQTLLESCDVFLPDEEFDAELHPELVAAPLPPSPGPNGTEPKNGTRAKPAAPGDGAKIEAADVRVGRQLELRLGIERMLRAPAETDAEGAAQGYGRAPTVFESKVCTLGAVSSVLTIGGQQIGSALRRANALMVEDICRRIEAGKVNRGSLTGLRRSRPKGEEAMVASVRERFLDVARQGRQHAGEELSRQAALLPSGPVSSDNSFAVLAAMFDDTPPSGDPNMLPAGSQIPADVVAAAEIQKLIDGGDTVSVLVTELAGEARVASQIAIDEIWARLLDEAIGEYNAAVRSGMNEAEALKQVEAALQGLSPAKNDLAARQLAEVAYNQGRDVAAKEAAVAGTATWVVRSEVLDTRTCAACRQLDGVYLKIGTKEYEQYLPPAKCQGGDNCRGFAVIVSDELAKALDQEDQAA